MSTLLEAPLGSVVKTRDGMVGMRGASIVKFNFNSTKPTILIHPLNNSTPVPQPIEVFLDTEYTEVSKPFDTEELWQRVRLKRVYQGDISLTTGTDPEVFVFNSNELVPAFEFLPKKTKKTQTFWDGFQAEFTVEPASCLSYLVDDLQERMCAITQKAKEHGCNDPRIRLDSVVHIPNITSYSKEHVELGCKPSLNVYGTRGFGVDDPYQLPIRFAGCHLHWGRSDGFSSPPHEYEEVVKTLDAIMGPVLVSLLGSLENPQRRQFYGRAGEYRLPEYGVEYRTPSSFILCHPAITHLVLTLGRMVVKLGLQGLRQIWDANEEEVQQVVNASSVSKAREILRRERNIEVLKWLIRGYYYGYIVDITYNAILNGVESVVKEPLNVEENWRFDKEWISHSESPQADWGKLARGL